MLHSLILFGVTAASHLVVIQSEITVTEIQQITRHP